MFALGHIEQEWVTDRPLSDIRAKLDEVMVAQPKYWEQYYSGTEAERALARNDPLSIIRHRIQEVLGTYARACGISQGQGV